MWANAASDHLREIEVPEEWKELEVGKKILELKEKALEIGTVSLAKLGSMKTSLTCKS